jgi:hypothetical protein
VKQTTKEAVMADETRSLGEAGAAMRAAILGDVAPGWSLDARDLALLHRACVLEDLIAALEEAVECTGATTTGSKGQLRVNPAISEMRALALAQQRLLSAVELEDPAVKIAEARQRTAARTVEWRRRARLGAA